MTEWVDLLLVDGPSAGQRVRVHHQDSIYTCQDPEPINLINMISPDQEYRPPNFTNYRIGFTYDLDRNIIRVGWSSGTPQPDPELLEQAIRQESPVKVIAGAEAWTYFCDSAIRMDPAAHTIQGACLCGWMTETVPKRRVREVLALADAHMAASIDAAARCAASQPHPKQRETEA